MEIFYLIICLLFSTTLYIYLHKKTRISINFIYKDNLIVGFLSFLLPYYLIGFSYLSILVSILLIIILSYSLTMLRFWRTPNRKIEAKVNEIISPADGNVIYIKKIDAKKVPISIKKKSLSSLNELTKTELLETSCWLIGINMTPFDVHKNCAPISGNIILNKHFNGKFLSLKDDMSLVENERNTFVIKNNSIQVGVIQIASKRVRRIDTYVKQGEYVQKGQWIGMIRFGSQVDLIIPENCKIKLSLGQQVYAIKTIIAEIL